MQIAQRLYQGIEIDGETIGLITYMRTDGQISQLMQFQIFEILLKAIWE
jgi:DNA topoisomerase IA